MSETPTPTTESDSKQDLADEFVTVADGGAGITDTGEGEGEVEDSELVGTDTISATQEPPNGVNGEVDNGGKWGCLRIILLVLASAILGAILAMVYLVYVNGTIDITRHESVLLLNSRYVDLSHDVEMISEQVNANTASINTINVRLDSLEAELNHLVAQSETMEETLLNVQTEIGDLDDALLTVDTRLGQVEITWVDLNDQIASADGRLLNIEERLSTAEADNGLQSEDLSYVLTETDLLNVAIVVISQQISDFQLSLLDLQNDLATLATASPPDDATPQPEPDTLSRYYIAGSRALTLFPPEQRILPPIPDRSHIFGLVWEDLNVDGIVDYDEIPLAAVVIELMDAKGDVLTTTETTLGGRYVFSDLEPGIYIVKATDLGGMTSVTPNIVTVTVTAGGVAEINFADAL